VINAVWCAALISAAVLTELGYYTKPNANNTTAAGRAIVKYGFLELSWFIKFAQPALVVNMIYL
jgi:hypothetical protein